MKLTLEHFKNLQIRDDVPLLLNEAGLTGEAAEIGVMYGGFARSILSRWQGAKYICVDLWEKQPQEVYREKTDDVDYEAAYRTLLEFASGEKRIHVIRKDSVSAAKLVANGSLDWVFIDGNHAYGPVLADMDAWYPKVKRGGVFSGHDYGDDTNWPNWCEVKSAVDRWMTEHRLPFVVDKHGSSWWALKP